MGVDQIVARLGGPGQELVYKGREVRVEGVHGRLGRASRQVHQPHSIGQMDNIPLLGLVTPGEQVDLNSPAAQVSGQLPHIHVHPPGLAVTQDRQGARVEADQGYPLYLQLRLTIIL